MLVRFVTTQKLEMENNENATVIGGYVNFGGKYRVRILYSRREAVECGHPAARR